MFFSILPTGAVWITCGLRMSLERRFQKQLQEARSRSLLGAAILFATSDFFGFCGNGINYRNGSNIFLKLIKRTVATSQQNTFSKYSLGIPEWQWSFSEEVWRLFPQRAPAHHLGVIENGVPTNPSRWSSSLPSTVAIWRYLAIRYTHVYSIFGKINVFYSWVKESLKVHFVKALVPEGQIMSNPNFINILDMLTLKPERSEQLLEKLRQSYDAEVDTLKRSQSELRGQNKVQCWGALHCSSGKNSWEIWEPLVIESGGWISPLLIFSARLDYQRV